MIYKIGISAILRGFKGQSESRRQNFCQPFPSDRTKSRIIFLSSGLKKSSSISKLSRYDFISELKFSISFCLESLSNRLMKFSSVQIITFFASSECIKSNVFSRKHLWYLHWLDRVFLPLCISMHLIFLQTFSLKITFVLCLVGK